MSSDAAFANVAEGKDPLPLNSQGGYILGSTTKPSLTSGKCPISLICWQSHTLKRKVRNALAAETMASNEASEGGDLIRAYLAELRNEGLHPKRNWQATVDTIEQFLIVDSRSLYDHLAKLSSTPTDKRLRLDKKIVREQLEAHNVHVRWVSTKQMPADALTKGKIEAMAYLRLILDTILV